MNIQQVLAVRIPYFHPDVPFVVAWAQKAGCTAVFKWFLFHAKLLEQGLEYKSDARDVDIHVFEREVFKVRPGYREGLRSRLSSGAPVINFIRCPYQRAFSSYLQIHQRGYITQIDRSMTSPGLEIRQAILRHVYGEDVCIEYTFSFLDYLRWLKQQDLAAINKHHAPQVSEIYSYKNIRHYRLEEFSAATRQIESEFGLESSAAAAAAFSSEHHRDKTEISGEAVMRLLERAVPVNPSPGFQFPRVTADLLKGTEYAALIEEIYAEDLRLYESLGT